MEKLLKIDRDFLKIMLTSGGLSIGAAILFLTNGVRLDNPTICIGLLLPFVWGLMLYKGIQNNKKSYRENLQKALGEDRKDKYSLN